VVDGDATRERLLETLPPLLGEGAPFAFHVVSQRTRDRIAALPELTDVLAKCGWDASRDEEALETLLSDPEAPDLVVVDAQVLVEPGWLDALRAAAYSDSVVATASALVDESGAVAGAVGLHAVVDSPGWGVTYVRRDALNVVARDPAGSNGVATVTGDVRELLRAPGFIHLAVEEVRAHPGPSRAAGDPGRLTVMIDARCLDRPLSGTQVHVLSLMKALADTGAVRLSALLPEAIHPTEKPAVFHRPYQFGALAELRAAARIGRRLVLTQQDMILDRTPEYHADARDWCRRRETTAAAFAVADQVGFFSRHAADDAARDGLDPSRSNVVPLGVDHPLGTDPAGGDAAGLELASPDDSFLLMIGGALRHKNRLFALRLFERLAESGWQGHLVLAGDHPRAGSSVPEEQAYLAERPRLRERVLDLGRVSDGRKRWLYEHARLVLFPSLYEGFGLVPFEAAACGTPCVYGWRSSLPEFLPEEGAVLEGWDVERCAAEVLDILNDERRAGATVGAIREKAVELTWAETARGYLEVYRRAVHEPSHKPFSRDELVRRLLADAGGGLTGEESRLLAVYRRRRISRAAIDGAIQSGALGMRLARRLRGRHGDRT
jgi:glycosyltransferase involved in cell wall biosynthesis